MFVLKVLSILVQFSILLCVNDNLIPKLGPVVNKQLSNVNSSLQIFCGVREGAQPFFFEWFKNSRPIRSGPGVKWEIENSKKSSTLNIDSVDKDDAGNYSCFVKNIHGSDSIDVVLNVKGIAMKFILVHFVVVSIGGAMVSINLTRVRHK